MNKWLGTPIISHFGHLEGEHPYSGDLPTMVRKCYSLTNWDDPPHRWLNKTIVACKSIAEANEFLRKKQNFVHLFP